MPTPRPWRPDGSRLALFVDLYELTMAQAYVAEGMHRERATFSLFVRRLPRRDGVVRRNFLLACGLDDVVSFLETLRFGDDDLAYLRSLETFSEDFLAFLADLRFTGDVHALPEGTPFFAEEPIVEVVAPVVEAQLVETAVMNLVHSPTVLASKAARLVLAADGRAVVDFGLRRTHGVDGGVQAARAYHVAGLAGTSNVLAGRVHGLPVAGTMAHSYVQAHPDELAAFRAFAREFPETILLVDTYDTLEGVRKVVALAEELGDDFRVRGVRLDSGDLAGLARESRRILDRGGLADVTIFASGGLDEDQIAALVAGGAPIDGFGVGTSLGVSEDAPTLDSAYKLTEYAGEGRVKLSTGKRTLPGRKQVFRVGDGGRALRDVIAAADETAPGRPLLRQVMKGGRALEDVRRELCDPDRARERARSGIAALPARVRGLAPADPPYEVAVSERLAADFAAARRRALEG